MPEASRQSLGKLGEALACRELSRRGYELLARRYRTRRGEIDLIARDGDTIVFVEVKARTSERWGSPADAITPAKRRRLALMASDYLARKRLAGQPCRFDVVALALGGRRPVVTLYRHAFTIDG